MTFTELLLHVRAFGAFEHRDAESLQEREGTLNFLRVQGVGLQEGRTRALLVHVVDVGEGHDRLDTVTLHQFRGRHRKVLLGDHERFVHDRGDGNVGQRDQGSPLVKLDSSL